MKNKIELFVIFHQNINDEFYKDELIKNYTFINVNPNNELYSINSKYKIIHQHEVKDFRPLGKWFAESEVIYNIYKNSYLYENIEYLGFLQHDIDSSLLTKEILDSLISNYDHINFQPYKFKRDYGQKILMDINQPNKKNGRGINCYDVIIKDYNEYYKTNYNLSELSHKTLNLCSSFILKKSYFNEMMVFISSVIESKKLDDFDVERGHRMQGGYLERYYAVWLALKGLNSKEFALKHYFAESTIKISLLKRALNKIGLSEYK